MILHDTMILIIGRHNEDVIVDVHNTIILIMEIIKQGIFIVDLHHVDSLIEDLHNKDVMPRNVADLQARSNAGLEALRTRSAENMKSSHST